MKIKVAIVMLLMVLFAAMQGCVKNVEVDSVVPEQPDTEEPGGDTDPEDPGDEEDPDEGDEPGEGEDPDPDPEPEPDPEPTPEPSYFTIDNDNPSYSFPAAAASVFIPVDTNIPASEWIITTPDKWCTVTAVEAPSTRTASAETDTEPANAEAAETAAETAAADAVLASVRKPAHEAGREASVREASAHKSSVREASAREAFAREASVREASARDLSAREASARRVMHESVRRTFYDADRDSSRDAAQASLLEAVPTAVDIVTGSETGVRFTIEVNGNTEVRNTSFRVGAMVNGRLKEYTVSVRQLGASLSIIVNNKSVAAAGGSFTFSVTSNIPVKLEAPVSDGAPCSWLELANNGQPLTRAMAEYNFEGYAFPNVNRSTRSATIRVTAADPAYNASAVITVTQAAGNGITYPETGPDTKLNVQSATASSTNPGSPVSKLYDGQKDNDNDAYIYHSLWDQNGGTSFPVTVTFKFASASRLSYINWYSRFAEYSNGNPGKLDVEYRLQGESWFRPAKSNAGGSAANAMYDMEMTAGMHLIRLPQSVDRVEEVRMIFYTGRGNYIAGVEAEFFSSAGTDGEQAVLNKIFTDSSYSELRPGVTRDDIVALYDVSPYFAEYVAMPLFSGTYNGYERDFRIGTYAAYSNGEDLWLNFRTRKYTRMDNPTGIYVNKGDKLMLCVGPMPAGSSCYLGIAGESDNGYTARFDDFDAKTGELVSGINEIVAGASGMCYIVNRAGNLTSSSGSVKVHFVPGYGRVVGYFDLKRHTDADYRALLNASPEKYFVAKGTNIIFNMHTATLRKYASTGITSGLKAWDNILGWQFELMGLAKQNADGTWDRLVDQTHFNNHMVAVSSSEAASYMDASNYRINFNIDSAIPKIISLELLNAAEDNTWGPAHEAGHVNQMFMLWKSTAESSNNLFSNYAIYKMGVYGSRGSRLDALANYYANGTSWVQMGAKYDEGQRCYTGEDTEIHMRLNWQLWNYFHRCGVDTGFWPRLYKLLCSDKYRLPNEQAGFYGMSEDNGKCQMLFAEAVCEAAQMDFTEFFEAWGFLRPVDITYSQYGTQPYKVTQAMINSLKTKMASYPRKAPAIQFLEDRITKGSYTYCDIGYYTTFMEKRTITSKPTYYVENSILIVSECPGAVGIEIRGPGSGSTLGELRYFTNWYRTVIPQNVSTTNMKVYVVQWDGKRIEATR